MPIGRFARRAVTVLAALAVAALAGAPVAGQASAGTGSATFVVMLQGVRVGTETATLSQTGGGWRLSGSSRLSPPFDVVVRQFDVTYGPDWQPGRMQLQGDLAGEVLGVTTTFGLTTAMNDVVRGGQRGSSTHQISSRSVVLPTPYFASYEALAARLGPAEVGTRIPVYVAPDGETAVVVRSIVPRRVSIGDATLDLRVFTLAVEGGSVSSQIELWVDGRNRLARLEMPATAVIVVRDDLASVMAREVRVSHPGDAGTFVPANGFSLGATITLPDGPADADLPAVVLLSTSGPRDRDHMSYGVPVYGQLAGALAEAGFVVVRYDPRGVGQSGGRTENATLEEYTDDALEVIDWLRDRDEVDDDRISVVGYGEAGTVALAAAARENDIKGVVLLGAPGTSGRDFALEQQAITLGQLGVSETEQAIREALQQRVIDAVLSGDGWETLPPDLRAQADTPWYRSWLEFEPGEAFRRMDQPVLVVHGDLDTEVPLHHADRLEALSAGRDDGDIDADHTRKVILPGLNHLFLPAETGGVDEYSLLTPLEISPEVAGAVAAWMNDLLGPDR